MASENVAKKLNSAWKFSSPLKIFIQINTSNEDSKGGVNVNDALPLAKFIISECSNLEFKGLMTIGSTLNKRGENPDFKVIQY